MSGHDGFQNIMERLSAFPLAFKNSSCPSMRCSQQNRISFNVRMQGTCDSACSPITPAAAQRAALMEALLAAHAARVPVRLLVDNEAIVKRLRRGLRCYWWTGDALGFWLFVAGITCGVEIMWVPSHYKKSGWQPELPWGLSADECRPLSSWAPVHTIHLVLVSFCFWKRHPQKRRLAKAPALEE